MGKMVRQRTYFPLVILMLISTCLQVTIGMMSPNMVHGMISSDELQPHLPGSVSAECMADLASVLTKETDFISVLDAIGKPQSGLLAGNLAWIGHYDECTNITDFKYCMSYLSVPVNSSDIPTQVIQLSWGLCVPVSCSDSDILSSLELILDAVAPESPIDISGVNASAVACAKQPTAPYDTGFLLTVLIIAILGVLLLLGAFLDVIFRSINYKPPTVGTPELNVNTGIPNRSSNDGEGEQFVSDFMESRETHVPSACSSAWQRFLLCFAVNRNLTKLLSVQASEGGIDCLNGIRVISMSWVILGHVAMFQLETGIVGNLPYGFSVMGTFGFQAVVNGYVSVDSFFYLSGLLVAYLALGKMQKTGGSIPWLWFYFHRYWRLTPALGMTTLLYLFIKPHMGNGPVWHLMTAEDPCSKHWWTNILYINNFYKGDCIGWVWYLANDMQFFLISPFILILLYRVPKFGLLTLAGMTVASAIITAILMVTNDLSAILNIEAVNGDAFSNIIYIKPYCRISPYLIGMAMGYFLHVNKKATFKLHPTTVAGGWTIATAIAMSIVYGLYGGYHGNPLSTAASAAYLSLSKIGWALSLSWVVFSCRYGYGGWVNEFLSWKLWTPFSRVTYGAYLLHPIILSGYFFNMKNNYFYSLYLLSFEFTGLFIMSYAAAVVVALFIEFPLGNLEKMIIPSRPKKID